jgi:hypothetical protein
MSGDEYARIPFQDLHDRLCAALRGTRPRLVLEIPGHDGTTKLVYEDGSATTIRGARGP